MWGRIVRIVGVALLVVIVLSVVSPWFDLHPTTLRTSKRAISTRSRNCIFLARLAFLFPNLPDQAAPTAIASRLRHCGSRLRTPLLDISVRHLCATLLAVLAQHARATTPPNSGRAHSDHPVPSLTEMFQRIFRIGDKEYGKR
jgi:hypothetical protein